MNVYYRNGLITGVFAGFAVTNLINNPDYWNAAILAFLLSFMVLSDWRRKLIGPLPQGEQE